MLIAFAFYLEHVGPESSENGGGGRGRGRCAGQAGGGGGREVVQFAGEPGEGERVGGCREASVVLMLSFPITALFLPYLRCS